MYESHFSFKYKPFELVPNPDFLYLSESHKKAITYLDYGVKEKIGFILLTGEIGSGKTTVVRNLIKNLNGKVKLSRVNNTKVSSEQLISMINDDFGLDVKGKQKTTLVIELNEFLIEQYAKGFQPILLIDEAQNLNPELLEEIRLLSNLETDRTKLLQIVLVGQPELKKTLMHPNLVQLRQRININYHITPLTVQETAEYIKHRITVAGNPNAFNIDKEMLEIINQFSRGIPRLINILCDFALLTAYVEGEKEVTVKIVQEIVDDLKANNYWNETGDASTHVQVSSSAGTINVTSELADEIINGVKERLVKLEEAVSLIIRNTAMDYKSLSERIARLEGNGFSPHSGADENKMAELSDRLGKLERMPVVVQFDKPADSHSVFESGDDRPVAEQVEYLKRMLNFVNNKLRKL